MKKILFLLNIFLIEAKQRNFIVKSLILGFMYLVLGLLLFEFKLYQNVLSQTYASSTKLNVMLLIFIDSFRTLGVRDSFLIVTISLLFGINLELVLRKIKFLKSKGSLHLTIGAGIISLFSAGCAACGLSFASVIGIAGVVSVLPFHGLVFFLFSIIVLLSSLFYNLHTLARVCKIKRS